MKFSGDDNLEEEESSGIQLKRNQISLHALETWYDNQYPREEKSKTKKQRKSLIVILEDFEAFPAPVLQDFILNLM